MCISLCWLPGPLVRSAISLPNANIRQIYSFYWPKLVVNWQIQVVDNVRYGLLPSEPTSEVRPLFVFSTWRLSQKHPLITCRHPRSFSFSSFLLPRKYSLKTHVDDLCCSITVNILVQRLLSAGGHLVISALLLVSLQVTECQSFSEPALHNLLIIKLHYIDYKNSTDGMHGSKVMLHDYQVSIAATTIASQIVNLKMIGDVLGLKSYQPWSPHGSDLQSKKMWRK